MDSLNPVEMFSALSQQMRLDVLRLLVKAGPEGILSGDIGERLGVRQNTMSANLAILLRARLITNKRNGRSVRYFANFDAVAGLIAFLLDDCCGGDQEICRPIFENLSSRP